MESKWIKTGIPTSADGPFLHSRRPAPFNEDFDPNHETWWARYIEGRRELIQALRAAGLSRDDAARAADPYNAELKQEAL